MLRSLLPRAAAVVARSLSSIVRRSSLVSLAARALLTLLCGDEAARLKRVDLRFASPAFPGETIRTEVWNEGPGRAAFRARVLEREQIILNNGRAEFTPAA